MASPYCSLWVIDGVEEILVQPFVTYRAIEPFYASVLSALARLNEHQADVSLLGPGPERRTAHFTAVV
jgi:hypothetical protein